MRDHNSSLLIDRVRVSPNPPIPEFSDIPPGEASNYVVNINGTSFAAPFVAGVAALVWAQRPELSAAQVRNFIIDPKNHDPFPCIKANVPCVAGGILNAFKILSAVTTPEVSILAPPNILTQSNETYTFPVRLSRAPGALNTSMDRVVFDAEISYRLDDEITIVQTTSLTFTQSNWYQPQSITLSTSEVPGGLFTIPDSNQPIATTIRLQAAQTPGSDPDFATTTTEKRICLQKPSEQYFLLGLCRFTNIEGEPITYHLELAQRPDTTLTLSISVMPGTAGSVSPAVLTFTPDNWNVLQTFIIQHFQVDLLSDATQQIRLQVILSDTSSNVVVSSRTQTIFLLDNQASPTLVLTPDNFLHLTGFSTQTASLRLGGQPAALVQVNLSIPKETQNQLMLSPDTLQFTPQNWNQAQTLFFRTRHLGTTTIDMSAQVDSDLSDPQYHNVATVLPVLIETQDLRILGLRDQTIVEGSVHNYALRLSSTPNRTFRILPVAQPSDLALFTSREPVFTAANWNTTQTLSIQASVDFQNTTDRIGTIVLDDITSHLLRNPTTSRLTLTDSLLTTPSFVVQPKQLRLTDFRSKTLSVRLNGNPDDNLELILTSMNPQQTVVSPASITFTPQNWFRAQNFFVRAPPFTQANTAIIIQPNPNSPDTRFRNSQRQVVPIAVDRRNVRLLGFDDQTITEGEEYTYHVRLSTTPSAIASMRGSELFISNNNVSFTPEQLTFTENDWNIPKPITVYVPSAITSNGVRFIRLRLNNIQGDVPSAGALLTVLDNGRRRGTPGMLLSKPGQRNLYIARDYSETLSLTITGQPIANVPVRIRVTPGLDASLPVAQSFQVTPSILLFTVDNWETPQSFKITTSLPTYKFSVVLQTNVIFDRATFGPIDIGFLRFVFAKIIYPPLEVFGLEDKIIEEGQTLSYDIRLAFPKEPAFEFPHSRSSATLVVSSIPPNIFNFDPKQLLFPSGRDSDAQRLTLSLRPQLFQKQQNVVLRLDSPTRSVHTTNTTAMITILQRLPLIFTPNSGLSISLQEQLNQITLYLDEQPEDPITLDLATDSLAFGVSPARLSFTPDNWNTKQTVTVAANPNTIIDTTTDTTIDTSTDTTIDTTIDTSTVASLTLIADAESPDSPFYQRTRTLRLHPLHLLGLDTVQILEGDSHTYQLRLSSTPYQTLTLIPKINPPGDYSLDLQQITFTPDNWNTAQSLTFRTSLNLLSPEEPQVSIRLLDTSAQLLSTPNATITIVDNGLPQFIFVPNSELSISRQQRFNQLTFSP